MSFQCGNCQRDDLACACADGPVHFCKNCGIAPSFEGFDDCVACGAAYLLTDPTQLALIRKLHAGSEWLKKLNAEIDRQLCTPMACGSAT